MTYINMLKEYKRAEIALRERMEKISSEMKDAEDSFTLETLQRRRILLEQEIYDLQDAIGYIYGYIGCGEDEKCRNA